MISIAVLLLSVDFAVNKIYQQKNSTSFKAGMQFNFFLGLFTAIIFFVFCGGTLKFSVFSLIMSIAITVFGIGYNVIGFKILKNSGMSSYTMFLMNGGMIVPYIYGVLFLNEVFSVIRTIGLAFIITAVIIANSEKETKNRKNIILCIIVFFLNGFVSVVSKLHQIEHTYEIVSATEFVLYTGLVKCLICGIILLFIPKTEGKRTDMKSFGFLPLIALSAVISGVSYLLQLFGAVDLPATVLYPFITGGSIVLSTIVGKIAFKENLSFKKVFGVIMCFIGTCMFL